VDADGLRYAGRGLFGDGGVPAVEEVVHSGLGDAGDVGQAPYGERSSGCALHELAQKVAVGEVQALSHVASPVHPRPWMRIAKHTA